MAHFARFASIYAQQWGYRRELMQEAAETGHPLIRYARQCFESVFPVCAVLTPT
jgi:hypothetical protein